jgi:hypothetical protein
MRTWLVKFAVIANAILAVVAFVGCPCRKNTDVVPLPIAPPRDNFIPPTISPPRDHFIPPAIAPPPVDFQGRVPPPPPRDQFIPPTISPPPFEFQNRVPVPPPPQPAQNTRDGQQPR